MTKEFDALSLFSGGLDSILSAKLVKAQGLRVLCLHFTTPFFGKPRETGHWHQVYDLEVKAVNIADEFVSMMKTGPRHGFGKALNPCIDCKILMLRKAASMMAEFGAQFLISGEVVGQRPMSQRKDALNLIRKEAGVRDILLRPLSGAILEPTLAETTGLVKREGLEKISGRGRKDQLRLAQEFGITEIPTPAGGCVLSEIESAKRFWPVLNRIADPTADDFRLAGEGRQYWYGRRWLVVGRNKNNNQRIENLARAGDYIFKIVGYPGPMVVGRRFIDDEWDADGLMKAARYTASFSPKAVGRQVEVSVRQVQGDERHVFQVSADKSAEVFFTEPTLEDLKRKNDPHVWDE